MLFRSVATLGCILPSIAFVAALGYLYNRFKKNYILEGVLSGLRPAVVAMILSAGISILLIAIFGTTSGSLNITAVIVFIVALFILAKTRTNPIFLLLISGLLGLVFYV